MRLASRFGRINQIRRDRPLTREELIQVVPSVFGEDKHASRSERYTCIPTITILENLQREGFQPFFACQSRVRDPARREYTKHMLRLRRTGQIHGQQVPATQILTPRRYEDRSDDLWTTYQRIQENLLKGGLPGRTAKGKRSHTRAVNGIDGDIRLNRALWVMAEQMQQALS
ncbi:DUF945 domain-containing protein [Salmonella enterica]|uniref:DUF945 domain-containing protein n=1 Tax=Salmonella enterica TaxID=28901 RepID=A0A5U2S5K9_SALER|nr:DUF945 domain-containing protein [Salmonella enterica]ECH7611807.1 DUF945 domain-containing protein [Salmonella enterica subsp. enterica serovar Potsdam]EDW8922674.1 DUF945 domain-containing protein [Salmonella enterica subsp. enterica serovar 6,7:l,v:-]EAW9778006.1 DUF945 domain-containing protein [Salmonella enterica]EAW9795194.1 DUF945 domain-containing protein [Salmonella enterica]